MCHTIGPYRNGIEWNESTEMEVIKLFPFNFEHVKGERKLHFHTNNINMYFKQNKE